MATPNKLNTMVLYPKRLFDPKSAEDLREYQYYLKNRKWRTVCPFLVEWPHACIPNMIEEKILKAHLKDIIDRASGKKEPAKKRTTNMAVVAPLKRKV